MPKKKKTPDNSYAFNRKALHDYLVLDKYEAGIMLSGAETKAVRTGKATMRESYAKFDRHGELWLLNMNIGPYQTKPHLHDPALATRKRKLLLHHTELIRLKNDSKTKGLTLVPLRLYDKHHRIKVEIILVKGKKSFDKRDDLKRKDIERDMKRSVKSAKYSF